MPGILTAVFFGSGLIGVGWYSVPHDDGMPPTIARGRVVLLLAKMAWFFLVTGAFTFGGGLAVVPLLEKGLVEQDVG